MRKLSSTTAHILMIGGIMAAVATDMALTYRSGRIRSFDIDGRIVHLRQEKNGSMEMYIVDGIFGRRVYDSNNDGKLDQLSSQGIIDATKPETYRGRKLEIDEHKLYERARKEYLAGKGNSRAI